MNGKISTEKKHTCEVPQLEKAKGIQESEVAPRLPTSGQVLGAIVKTLGINDRKLRSKTARRFFSGRLSDRVKESSCTEIIAAIADALADVGLDTTSPDVNAPSPTFPPLVDVLDWHARNWDQLRAILRPRMPKVFPRHLDAVWRTYVRLVAIDLALRAAAHIRLAGASPAALDFLDWIGAERRGAYLNKIRSESGRSVLDFAEATDVSVNAVEAWLYDGVRPSNNNLIGIAKALTPAGKASESKVLLRELRRLYWASDLAELLAQHIGAQAVTDIAGRLRRYATQLHGSIGQVDQTDLVELATLGHRSPLAQPLLTALHSNESDEEWRAELQVEGTDVAWVRRLVAVNTQVHQGEVDNLIQETDGRLLKNWDVSNPEAYAHYQRAGELQLEGRIDEALAEVAIAIQLDPMDPANHFTMATYKGEIGMRTGDMALIKEGLDASWMAATLDPNWILPWTEIGWLLLGSGKPKDAIEHLRGVGPEREPLDAYYFTALGMALMQVGRYAESLAAFESTMELDPDDPRAAGLAATVASLSGDTLKANRYHKAAGHLGATEKLEWQMEMLKATATPPPFDDSKDHDQQIAALNAFITRNPDTAEAYFNRARAYFAKGEDGKAILDLNTIIKLEPGNADAYLFRGIASGNLGRFDHVIADASEAIRRSPDNAVAHYYRGLAYREQGDFDLAIRDFDEAIRIQPDHADTYQARGDCYRQKSEPDRAIDDLDTALKLDNKDPFSFVSRGAAYHTKHEYPRAIADYEAALRVDPENSSAYRFRGHAYLAMRYYARAVEDFDVALRIDPSDGDAYRGRGNAFLFGGNPELAIPEYDAALECDPDNADLVHLRAVARKVTGDTEGAAEDYRRARELGYDDA